jgi:hypothetical protein
MNIIELYNSFQFYPELDDKEFQKHLTMKKEFYDLKSEQTNDPNICYKEIIPRKYQKFVSIFLQHYNSLLMFHGLGTGKTRTSIYTAELIKDTTNIKYIVVLAGKSIQDNYKQTLSRIYNEKNIDKDLIKQYYNIYGYLEFINRIQKLSNDEINKIYSNTLFIIDEIHNIRQDKDDNKKIYPKLIHLLNIINNSKLLLMSGTPMFDKPNEIISIINLLRTNDKRPIQNSNSFFDNQGNLLDNNTFIEYCNGYISFVKGENPETFPIKIEIGELLPNSKYTLVIPSTLSPLQINELNNIKNNIELKKKDTTKVFSTQYSNIIYPNNDFSLIIESFNHNMFGYKIKNLDFFNNIELYAPKFINIYKNIIENPNGIHFIYSNYIQHGVIPLTLYLLQQNDFNWINSNSKFKIAVLLGETTMNTRNQIINMLNSNENQNGQLLNIIIGSSVTREGLDFRGIRYIHILEPYWDFSLLNQVIGRGIRYCSHSHLPIEQRNVKIFRYVNLYNNNTDISPDQELYIISENKQEKIKIVERLLKEIAVDCHINNNINNFGIDYTPDCDFMQCQINCKSNIENIPINTDTYNYILTNDKENSQILINILQNSFIWSRNNIYILLDGILTEKEIDNALYYILNNYITFKDKYNRNSYLVFYNNYFYLLPYETYNFQNDYSNIFIHPKYLENMKIRDFLKEYNIGQEFIEKQELRISIDNLDQNTKKELIQSIIKKSIEEQIYTLSEDEKQFISTIQHLITFNKSKYFNHNLNYNIDNKIIIGYSIDNTNYFTYGRLKWNDKKVIFDYKPMNKFIKVDNTTMDKYFELDNTGGIEKNKIKYILTIIDKNKLAKYTGFNDPVFKIIETNKPKNFGKKCTTFHRDEILNITEELGIITNKKNNIFDTCKIIEEKMKESNTQDKIYYININDYSAE